MKSRVVYLSFLPMAGMALFPFILVKQERYKTHKVLLNHERIHLKQQLELLLIGFYLLYFMHYLVNLVRFLNHNKAYLNIIFEREAYSKERDMDYLAKRTFWQWTKY